MKLFSFTLCTFILGNELKNYAVTSCNGDDNIPEMNIRILKTFQQDNSINVPALIEDGDYFTKAIPMSDLTFLLDDANYWSLNYSITSPARELGLLIFQKEFKLDFKCKYARAVTTEADNLNTVNGFYEWLTNVTYSDIESRVKVSILPKYPIPSITARIMECSISHEDEIVYPIHSFNQNGTICKEANILNVTTDSDLGELGFSYNAFQFIKHNQTDQQELQLSCKLHIFETEGYVDQGMEDCECLRSVDCIEDNV